MITMYSMCSASMDQSMSVVKVEFLRLNKVGHQFTSNDCEYAIP